MLWFFPLSNRTIISRDNIIILLFTYSDTFSEVYLPTLTWNEINLKHANISLCKTLCNGSVISLINKAYKDNLSNKQFKEVDLIITILIHLLTDKGIRKKTIFFVLINKCNICYIVRKSEKI